MPQLNDDGLPGFSANDWLSPVITSAFIGVYARLRPPADAVRFNQTWALAASPPSQSTSSRSKARGSGRLPW